MCLKIAKEIVESLFDKKPEFKDTVLNSLINSIENLKLDLIVYTLKQKTSIDYTPETAKKFVTKNQNEDYYYFDELICSFRLKTLTTENYNINPNEHRIHIIFSSSFGVPENIKKYIVNGK